MTLLTLLLVCVTKCNRVGMVPHNCWFVVLNAFCFVTSRHGAAWRAAPVDRDQHQPYRAGFA